MFSKSVALSAGVKDTAALLNLSKILSVVKEIESRLFKTEWMHAIIPQALSSYPVYFI